MENVTRIDGARIRALRLERHWTQKQLAVRSGIDQSIISKLEHQTKPHLNAATVMALARALGVTVEDLLVAGTPKPIKIMDLRLYRAFRLLSRLSPEEQRWVELFIRFTLAQRSPKNNA